MNRVSIERIIAAPNGLDNWCEYKVNGMYGYEPLGELSLNTNEANNEELVEHLKDSILDVFMLDEVTNNRLANNIDIKSVSYLLEHIVRNCRYGEVNIANIEGFDPYSTITATISNTEYEIIDELILEGFEREITDLSIHDYFMLNYDTCKVIVNPNVISQFLF